MWFEDEDVDFDDKNIIISRRGINNGDIINITSNELIFEFTQNDILKKEIAFRHRGLSYDQFVFWAKDGAHSTASMMRVQAGPPLITIDVTPELSIQKDSEAEITLKNLTLSTNMNIQVSAINWFLVEEPLRGAFYVDGVKVRQWKHGDVMAGNVIFKHTSREKNYKDSFIIKAYHSRLESTELKVDVNYYMEHYQLPLKE